MIRLNKCQIRMSSDRFLNVDLDIHDGENVLIVGANGVGKTTLLDTIAGFRIPEAGSIEPRKCVIGYAPQESANALLPWNSIIENILFPAALLNKSMVTSQYQAAAELMEVFGLRDRLSDYPQDLSGGEKQIVNFARALLTPCNVLILDEIFSSLNRKAAEGVITLLSSQELETKTLILTSHDLIAFDLKYDSIHSIDAAGHVYPVARDDAIRELSNGPD